MRLRSPRPVVPTSKSEITKSMSSSKPLGQEQTTSLEKDQLGIEDHTIYLINELGQYEVLNQDLSGLDMAEEIKEVPTELDVIVQEINHLHQQEGIAAVAQPWLPPLKERITLDELDKVVPIEAWQNGQLQTS